MKKKLEYITFEKNYLLLHEILETLRKVGMTVTATGNEESGYLPLFEFQVKTAQLHFGTLVGLLNEPDKYKGIQFLQNHKTKREEIKANLYTWYDVATSVDTLAIRGEVEKQIVGQFIDLEGKIIKLTEKGFQSLNTKKYQKKYEKERNERTLYESTLSTNFWMKIFTGVLALSAILTLITQLNTFNQSKLPQVQAICQPKCKKYIKDSTVKDSLSQGYSKEREVILKTDSTKVK